MAKGGKIYLVVRNASLLDATELREIEDLLNLGELDQAQQLLANVDVGANEQATNYLATRLLYLRDRLDPERVILRLKELLSGAPNFDEAKSLLRVAETGVPGSQSLSAMAAVRPANSDRPPSDAPARSLGHRPTDPAPMSLPEDLSAAVFVSAWPEPETDAEDVPDSERPTAVPDEHSFSRSSRSPELKIEVDTQDVATPISSRRVGTVNALSRSSRPAGRYAFADPAWSSTPPGGASLTPRDEDARRPDAPREPTIPRAPNLPQVRLRPPSRPPNPLSNGTLGYKPPSDRPVSAYPPPAPASIIPARRSLKGDAGRYALNRSDRPPRVPSNEKPAKFRVPRPGSLAPSSRPIPLPEESRMIWPDIEVELFAGNPGPALSYLERSAEQALVDLEDRRHDFHAAANAAASFLTGSWVSHHFAPFDLSLQSLARLDLFLSVLLQSESRRRFDSKSRGFWVLIGAYVGETLRLSHGGEWSGELAQPDSVVVKAGGRAWRPFSLVRDRLLKGEQFALGESLKPELPRAETQAWRIHRVSQTPLPRLWDDLPGPEHMPVLGAGLCHSVLSVTCGQLSQSALDRSVRSLGGLNQVIDVLTRSAVPLTGAEPWLQRLALLAGAYVGEVLRTKAGGEWRAALDSPLLERYFLRLPNGREAKPAEAIANRALVGKKAQLQEYVQALMRPLR